METSQEILDFLDSLGSATESEVFIREIRLTLDIDHDWFTPNIKIKTWLSNVPAGEPYSYTISHYVKTPLQGAAYISSRTWGATEEEVIQNAISAFKNFLYLAIKEGLEPNEPEPWLVPNETY